MTAPAAFQVQLTRPALTDLDEIARYRAAQRGLDPADALLDSMLERIATLERLPHRGSIPKELDGLGASGIRQIVHASYRILYEVEASTVSIILVADGRRDVETLLHGRMLDRGSRD